MGHKYRDSILSAVKDALLFKIKEVSEKSASDATLTENLTMKSRALVHQRNLSKQVGDFSYALLHKRDGETSHRGEKHTESRKKFPTSLCMYNLGVKNEDE